MDTMKKEDYYRCKHGTVGDATCLYCENERFTLPIVCICGSTRFKQAWITENARLTGGGNIVLAVGLWGHHEKVYPSHEEKLKLDEIHKRKIDLCDWVWVLDVNSYIGDSTRSEIEYAEKLGKPIRYLSKEYPEYVEPSNPVEERAEQVEKERDDALASLAVLVQLAHYAIANADLGAYDLVSNDLSAMLDSLPQATKRYIAEVEALEEEHEALKPLATAEPLVMGAKVEVPMKSIKMAYRKVEEIRNKQ
jgi:hypothetical protein